MRKLICIIDTLANDIVGVPQIFRHEAPAIRQFGDIMRDPKAGLLEHAEDFQLVKLAEIDDNLTLTPTREVLITGAQWRDAQQHSAQLPLGGAAQ